MEPIKEKVVKCKNCNLFFGHSEKNTKCPFCKTEYIEVDPVRSREGSQRASASNGVEEKTVGEKPKEKKEAKKTRKESFKIWKNN